jgi:hypothetical protein
MFDEEVRPLILKKIPKQELPRLITEYWSVLLCKLAVLHKNRLLESNCSTRTGF